MNTYNFDGFEFSAADVKDGILIDPVLPADFYGAAIEDRSASEIEQWEGLPYIVSAPQGFRVECLDGGAWDRPTLWGQSAQIDEAVSVAKSGPAWQR